MRDRVEVVVAGRDRPSGRSDVVVLDPDAVMGDGWLDKLRRCASSDPRIGTVVPWCESTLLPARIRGPEQSGGAANHESSRGSGRHRSETETEVAA